MYKKIICLLIILLCCSVMLYADTFTTPGIGARAMGMGNAFTAIADDVYAVYYNPAGLVNVKYQQLSAMYYNMYEDGLISNMFFGFAAPYSGPGTFALGWNRLGVNDDLMLKDFNENIISASYGYNDVPYLPDLSLGLTLKFLAAFYGRYKGLGWGADVGVYYNVFDYGSIGIIYQDMNKPSINWDTELKEDLDSNLRAGVAVRPLKDFAVLSFDIDQILRDRKNMHAGLEVSPFASGLADFRAGLVMIAEEKMSYSFGATLHISRISIDYSLYNHANLGNSSILGLTYEF